MASSSGHVTSIADGAPMTYYVIVTSYCMLPVRRRACCLALGVMTGLGHLVVFTVMTALQSTDHLVFQVNVYFVNLFSSKFAASFLRATPYML